MTAEGADIGCSQGDLVWQLPLHADVELVDGRIFETRGMASILWLG